jgi:hypothetical protein
MNEQQTPVVEAAPSVAPASPTFEIPRSGTAGYDEWRKSGTLPEKQDKTQQAVTSTADTSKETPSEGTPPESAAESETAKDSQEKPKAKKLTADGRIAQIDATIERLWAQDEPDTIKIAQLESTKEKIEQRAGLKRKTDTAPVAPQPAQVQRPPQPQYTRPKPSVEAMNQDGTPKYGSYEDYVEDLAGWMAEQQIVQRDREYAVQQQAHQLWAKVEQGKEIYGEDFGQIADDAAGVITKDANFPPFVLQRLTRSEFLPHLLYTMAGEPDGLAAFVATAKADPYLALDRITLTENLIREDFSKRSASARDAKGQFASTKADPPPPPARRGPESAAEPPIEIGNRGSATMDESERALKSIGQGNPKAVRDWMAAENAKDLRRRKGL